MIHALIPKTAVPSGEINAAMVHAFLDRAGATSLSRRLDMTLLRQECCRSSFAFQSVVDRLSILDRGEFWQVTLRPATPSAIPQGIHTPVRDVPAPPRGNAPTAQASGPDAEKGADDVA